MGPSLTQETINAILRAFLIEILPAGTAVTIAQQNLVPEPAADNFVLITLLSRRRLGTTVEDWDQSPSGNPTTLSYIEAVSISMQLDFHGANSTDDAQTFATLFRSGFAYEFMASTGLYPDYCTDGLQAPFINAEEAWENRWIVNAVFDCNISVLASQQFANQIQVGLVEVDTVFPPAA